MRSTLDELGRELRELRDLVDSIDPVNSVLAGHQDTLVQKYVVVRRRFDYAAFAVVLYASFEKFIENLVFAYAKLDTRRVPYKGLPKKLLAKHLFETAKLLSHGRLGEGRYVGLHAIDVVKILFECLGGVTPYTLNEKAIIAHDMNLRVSEIDRLFATVGLETICDRVRCADALREWFCTSNQLDSPISESVPKTTVEKRIEDIVERRNRVSHRGGSPDDLLGSSEMKDSVLFIEAFSKSVFVMVVGQYLKNHHGASGQGIRLQQRQGDGPFKNGKVVVIEAPEQRIFVGQPVFVVRESFGARWGRIQSLKVDNADVDSIEPNAAATNGIGIGLNFTCPKDVYLVALVEDDDVVWSRQD